MATMILLIWLVFIRCEALTIAMEQASGQGYSLGGSQRNLRHRSSTALLEDNGQAHPRQNSIDRILSYVSLTTPYQYPSANSLRADPIIEAVSEKETENGVLYPGKLPVKFTAQSLPGEYRNMTKSDKITVSLPEEKTEPVIPIEDQIYIPNKPRPVHEEPDKTPHSEESNAIAQALYEKFSNGEFNGTFEDLQEMLQQLNPDANNGTATPGIGSIADPSNVTLSDLPGRLPSKDDPGDIQETVETPSSWTKDPGTSAEITPPIHSTSSNEMLYFALWYAALVLCCIIPSFVVYKRKRKQEERRLVELRERAARSTAAHVNLDSNGNSRQPIHTDMPGWKEKLEESLKEEWALSCMKVQKKHFLATNPIAAKKRRRSSHGSLMSSTSVGSKEGSGRKSILSRFSKRPPNPHDRYNKYTLESLPTLDITDPSEVIMEEDETENSSAAPPESPPLAEHSPMLNFEEPTRHPSPALIDPSYLEADGGSMLTVESLQSHDIKSGSSASGNPTSPGNSKTLLDPAGSDNGSSLGSMYSTSGYVLCIPEKIKGKKTLINGGPRHVPISCAICLDSYEVDDLVVWNSCDGKCPHAFHESCISMWCIRKIEENPRCESVLCPCCRQAFVLIKSEEPNSQVTINLHQENSGDSQSEIAVSGESETLFAAPHWTPLQRNEIQTITTGIEV